MNDKKNTQILFPVLVASLGYFVDIYDLLIFSIVRVPSLKDLGLNDVAITLIGEKIISFQMLGFLIGGVAWGIAGDKKGRIQVLYGSILLYSFANIANAFVQNEWQYSLIRFIAGLGLAGELGGGVTLLCELLPTTKRGISTTILTSFGILGAVFAFFLKENFHWRTCYLIGGVLGLLLLLLRTSVLESSLYGDLKQKSHIQKGNFLMIFQRKERALRYFLSVFIGLPLWLVAGIYFTFARELGLALGIPDIDSGKAVFYGYMGLSIGDLICGILSQKLQSRKKALNFFYFLSFVFILIFHTLLSREWGSSPFYFLMACLGFSSGYWGVFVTIGAEQFGTNLRATAATSIPNMVRGALFFPILPVYREVFQNILGMGILMATFLSALLWLSIAVLSAYFIKESFHKDLNYVEE